ncbi:hypothetical protein U1707_08625 [Sphingomonas sp. PB2P12]|uniref:hypothetical protein n=1 Tax=Sphingomonas sandaracina TaxID=3096157 RepID=UPI002FC9609F
MAEQEDGWETITDPSAVPADIRKSLGVKGVRSALGIDAKGGGKAIPQWAEKKYSPQVETYAGLTNALNGFKDDFGGNTVTGGLENTVQGLYSGFGSEGQRDWWASFKSNDNQIRNKLFGSALTDTEKAAYEATTISPSMDPKEIRRNLTTRRSLVQKALQRSTKFLQAQGYNGDSISALAGEYAPELGAIATPDAASATDAAKPAGATGAAAASAATGGEPPAGPTPPSGPDSRGDVQFNGDGPQLAAGVSKLSPEVQEKLYQFSLTKPNAAQLKQYYDTLGAGVLPDANAQQIADYYAKGGTERIGVSYDKAEVAPIDPGDGTVGAVGRGVVSNIPFSREIAAGIDTLSDPQSTFASNLDEEYGKRAFVEQNNPVAYTAGAILGSLPLGGVEFAGARAASRAAGVAAIRQGLGREVAVMQANRTFAMRSAMEGAGISGVYALGNADGSLGQRVAAGVGGAAVGGVAAGALSLGGGALLARRAAAARGGAPALSPGQEALEAAGRQDIVPFPADVGGSGVRSVTGAVAQTMGGVGPIRAGAQRTLNSAEAVRNRVASAIGTPQGIEEAGETARAGAQTFIARTGARIGRIYERAASLGGQARVDTPAARRVLDQELAPLLESPVQGPGVPILQGLLDALDNPQSIRGLREARSQLREQFENAGLRGSNLERVAGRVIDAATDDMVNGLRSQGLDAAARLYRVADRAWRERLQIMDDHLAPILGDASGPGMKSGEQVVQGLKSAMAGNNRRFAGFVGALPPHEQGVVRASLIQRMGMATKGNQDEAGEVFSLSTFLTNWNEIGERAKNTLFGPEGRAALNDLAIYAREAKQSQKFANHSNSAGAVSNLSAIWNFSTLGTALAAENGGGRVLASPRFARWLARPPRAATPAASRAWVERLTRVAKSEPAIAQDVLGIQTRLRDMLMGSPATVAAQEGATPAQIVQGQNSQQQAPTQGAQQ